MCVLVFAFHSHPEYKFIFAGNRDEFYNRPTKPASIHGNDIKILSGIDLKSNGIWLGVTVERKDEIPPGDFVVITNHRDFYRYKENSDLRSRGLLALDFLLTDYPIRSPNKRFDDFSNYVLSNCSNYNPFNLIFGNFDKLYYFSSVKQSVEEINHGIHGLSNSFLNIPWPKVHWAKLRFADIIRNSEKIIDDLFDLLANESKFPDELLPDTGVGLERERLLSSIFIKSEIYGTRSSTVLIVDYNDNMKFIERNYINGELVDRTFEVKLRK